MARRFWQVADALFLVMFMLSALVQFNDPDPIPWAAVYAAAALACLVSAMRRSSRWVPLGIGGIALVWALSIAPRVVGTVRFLDMFAEWEMQNLGVEESREMYGLLVVALWMASIALRAARPLAKRA